MMKKLLVILLIVQVLFLRSMPVALAQTVPTDTPAPTPTVDPNATPNPTPTVDPNTTTPTPTIDPNAATPTPTVDPSIAQPTATPTPTVDVTATNSGTVNNKSQSTAISGDNSVLSASTSADPSATPSADVTVTPTDTPNQNPSSDPNNPTNAPNSATPTPSQGGGGGNATITTGNAVAVTNTDNSINTNSINSQFVNQTINIFVTQNGNLDLSVPLNIVSQLITQQNNVSPQINLLMNSDNSYAVVTNNIVNNANSGNNTIADSSNSTGSGQMIINTGNAYSVVALTNKVNFTIVDSVVHVITINIFGTLNGNIILPDLSHNTICQGCGLSASIVNTATVDNNVSSTAVSGQNTATIPASGSATITTGNAVSVVNIDNIVNTNVIGIPFEHLFINAFGLWNGSFLGWGGFAPQIGGRSYAFNALFPNGANTDCPNCANSLNIQNNATVTNNITSNANSGGNTTTGGDSSIKTGNAYSAVQLLNFVNANFIRTFGFFGFINIFGHFNGSIGSAADFITPTPTPGPDVLAANTTTTSNDPVACTTTGDPAIATKLSDNVGAFVNPGDTILFYVRIKNTGPNDLQSEKVKLVLSDNGKQIGGTILTIKKPISVGKSELVTVGLSLSHNAPGGLYTATATTEGITCDNKTALATASTTFQVTGFAGFGKVETPTPTAAPSHVVLGAHTTTASANAKNWLGWVLLAIVIAYLIIRGIRSRQTLLKLIRENMSLKERLATLRLLLL